MNINDINGFLQRKRKLEDKLRGLDRQKDIIEEFFDEKTGKYRKERIVIDSYSFRNIITNYITLDFSGINKEIEKTKNELAELNSKIDKVNAFLQELKEI